MIYVYTMKQESQENVQAIKSDQTSKIIESTIDINSISSVTGALEKIKEVLSKTPKISIIDDTVKFVRYLRDMNILFTKEPNELNFKLIKSIHQLMLDLRDQYLEYYGITKKDQISNVINKMNNLECKKLYKDMWDIIKKYFGFEFVMRLYDINYDYNKDLDVSFYIYHDDNKDLNGNVCIGESCILDYKLFIQESQYFRNYAAKQLTNIHL